MLARQRLKRAYGGWPRAVPEGRLSKAPLIAIVEDDEFVRGSMRRLMRSLGYPVEAFPSAAGFLAFRRLDETACLIADIQMPGMTGVELYARLIEAGHKIPTILVTAYPDEARRARALKTGSFVTFLSRLTTPISWIASGRLSRAASRRPRIHESLFPAGRVN